jgi:hypothetical protein
MLLAALLIQAAPPPPVRRADCYRDEVRGTATRKVYRGDRECVAFTPPQVMEGIWLRAFEGSEFHERARTRADIRSSVGVPWFSVGEPLKAFADPLRPQDLYEGRLYRVRFIGRRSVAQNQPPMEGFGHMGGSSSLVLLDEMLSIEDLGPLTSRERAD